MVVAGYAVPEEKVADLLAAVEETKKLHCDEPRIPVKWNLRGEAIERALTRHGLTKKKDLLIEKSKEVRAGMLADMRSHGCILFASVKEGFVLKEKETRHYLADFGFANILQRFGYFARSGGGGHIHLDWPSSNDPEPLTAEYLSGGAVGTATTVARSARVALSLVFRSE